METVIHDAALKTAKQLADRLRSGSGMSLGQMVTYARTSDVVPPWSR